MTYHIRTFPPAFPFSVFHSLIFIWQLRHRACFATHAPICKHIYSHSHLLICPSVIRSSANASCRIPDFMIFDLHPSESSYNFLYDFKARRYPSLALRFCQIHCRHRCQPFMPVDLAYPIFHSFQRTFDDLWNSFMDNSF